MVAVVIRAVSIQVYCLSAETIPAGRPIEGWSVLDYSDKPRRVQIEEADGNNFAVIPSGSALTSDPIAVRPNDLLRVTLRARGLKGAPRLAVELVPGPGAPLWPGFRTFFKPD